MATLQLSGGPEMAPNDRLPPNVLTVIELAGYLRVHSSTIYRLIRRGSLPSFKVGSELRFVRDDIDRWRFGQATAALSSKN